MNLTWGDLFKIIEIMWDLNQNDIARYLGVTPSTISRLINGETKRFNIKSKDIYAGLFDPTNEHIPKSDKSEKHLLTNLIEAIEAEGFSDIIKDLKTGDYKPFVMELLQLIKGNQPLHHMKIVCRDNNDVQNEASSKDYSEIYSETINKSLLEIFRVPFDKNEYFVGRSDVLEQVQNKFARTVSDGPIRQTLCGLGGTGKTQLALKYAYESIDKYRVICWVECSSEDTTSKSCRGFLAVAEKTEIIDADSQFTHWFQTHSDWLLIFDDVNRDTPIEHLIPRTGKGHILITTREKKDSAIGLGCMSGNEAVEFLMKRAKIDDVTSADLIVDRLGRLPLALEQAAAYISEMDIDFEKYLNLIHEHDLKILGDDGNIDTKNRNVHTVWNITLEKLSDDTKRLLHCFVYMSADNIELEWLIKHAQKLKDALARNDNMPDKLKRFFDSCSDTAFTSELIAVLTDEFALNKALRELKQFSLVSLRGDKSYIMHSLFQEIVRSRVTDPSYLLSIWEVLKKRCNYTDLIYKNYQIALPLEQAEPLIKNIDTFLQYHEKLVKNLNETQTITTSIDIDTLEFQSFSFKAQYLTLRGDDDENSEFYEEADKYYSKSCNLALVIFGGNEEISNSHSFILIQEKYRRMYVNLKLKRNDVAEKIYEDVKETLEKSISGKTEMVRQAFINYADLWDKFGFSNIAEGALKLAEKCNSVRDA